VQGINQVLITSYVGTKITRVLVLVQGIHQVLITSSKNHNHEHHFSLSGLSFLVTAAAFSLPVSEEEEASFGF